MIFFSLVILVHLVVAIEDFEDWAHEHGIPFPESVENVARENFEENRHFVDFINSQPGRTFDLGMNEFTHIRFKDFKITRLGVKLPDEKDRLTQSFRKITLTPTVGLVQPNGSIGNYTATTAPGSVNYTGSYVLPVQNQRSCGSCYIFSAISVLESRKKIFNPLYKTLLSEQYSLDCDTTNSGCNGGWPYSVIRWIYINGGNGVPSLKNYPYKAKKGVCNNTITKVPMAINSVVQKYLKGDETALKVIVANVGPVSVAIDVRQAFQLYSSGIFYDPTANNNCSSVNHAVTITGYGTQNGVDYWIVKNSWGTGWGEQGYIRMTRNYLNNCNIACWAMYAT